jgi:hypothetical protein
VLSPFERLAFLVDILGTSKFRDDVFTVPTQGKLVPAILPSEFIRAVQAEEIVAVVPRADLVNLSVGFKVKVFGTCVAFADVILPITNDGLRANVIPAGGVEYRW